ncbi:hypothetical protein AMTRI_Chr09g17220 [Amborella trichopoda]
MAALLTKEWTGIRQFPPATQAKLLELLGKLKEENVSTVTILVVMKGGVGQSLTVNSLLGERVAEVSAFQSEAMRPIICSRARAGFTFNIIDTPGLVEGGGFVNENTLEMIKRFLLNKTIDILLYVDRLDSYWLIIWTDSCSYTCSVVNPDGLSYDEFFLKRSEGLLKVFRSGARMRIKEIQTCPIPVVLAENSGRCNTNDSGEKIVRNGTAWLPDLVKNITEVVLNGSHPVLVDKKLIEGPDANNKGQFLIPFILAFQYFFVVRRIKNAIKPDIAQGSYSLWELRDMGLANRQFDHLVAMLTEINSLSLSLSLSTLFLDLLNCFLFPISCG